MGIELSETQHQRFERDGVLIVDHLIEPVLALRLADRYEHLFQGDFETGVRPDEVNWQESESRPDLTRQICNGWKADRLIASVVLSEDIGRAAAGLAGWCGARLMHDNVLWKPAGSRPLGFHQDNSYLSWFDPGEILTCWIALDDTTAEGGTMELVRGSHKWRQSPMASQFHGPEAYRADMETAAREQGVEPEIVPVVVPRGGGSFHHGWTWHGSGFNDSDRPRRSLVIHMCSSESRFVPARLGNGNGAVYSRYRRLGDERMDENYFPILWTSDNRRTAAIETYLTG